MSILLQGLSLSLSLALTPVSSSMAEPSHVQQKQSAQQQYNQLIQQRANFQNLFLEAYKQNPSLPKGLLESLAFTASRWQHILPNKNNQHGNNQRPQAYGLFGLYDTNDYGFVNTLALVANSYNISQEALLDNLDFYIFATAYYLAEQIKRQQITGDNLADFTTIIASLSGIAKNKSDISQYANNSFVYDVLLSASTGVITNGIEIKPQIINWHKAFKKQILQQLKAPKIIFDSNNQTINSSNTSDVDYPSALWHATPNNSSRKGSEISHITLHTTQGSYSGSITWLANTAAQASAHYVIRSNDGQVTQMVRDTNKAWHARSANPYTIGIEHEGYVDNPDWYTEALYTSSANLTIYLCANHPIDCTKGYAGSSNISVELLDLAITVKGHQHYPDQDHTDPGINWDWPKYFTLITQGKIALPNQAPKAIFTTKCSDMSCSFDASSSSDFEGDISKYQWDFGDNNKATGVKVNHTYVKSASYTVTLTVEDGEQVNTTKSIAINVKAAMPIKQPEQTKSGGGSIFWLILIMIAGVPELKPALKPVLKL